MVIKEAQINSKFRPGLITFLISKPWVSFFRSLIKEKIRRRGTQPLLNGLSQKDLGSENIPIFTFRYDLIALNWRNCRMSPRDMAKSVVQCQQTNNNQDFWYVQGMLVNFVCVLAYGVDSIVLRSIFGIGLWALSKVLSLNLSRKKFFFRRIKIQGYH